MTVTLARPTFETYVAARSAALLRFAYVLCGDRHLAEDLVQEVLIRAYRRWSAIEAENPDGYLKQALVRTHITWRRRRSSTEVASDAIPDEGRAAGFDEAHASRDELWALLGKLSAAQRCVLVLRYFEDLDDQRIAEILGATQNTVRVHAHRGLARLRELIAASDAAQALAQVSTLPDTLTRGADDAPAAKPGLVDSVRTGAARVARRRRIAVGVAGAGLAALIALLLVLPDLWGSGHNTPPAEPTPTITPSPLPTSTLELVPAVLSEPLAFPYVFTAVPQGYEQWALHEWPESQSLVLNYHQGAGYGLIVRMSPEPPDREFGGPYNVETVSVNGIPATVRWKSPEMLGHDEQPCISVTWFQDGHWLVAGTCDQGLTIDDLVAFASSIRPGVMVSPVKPLFDIVRLPAGHVVRRAEWSEHEVCAGPGSGTVDICVRVVPLESTPRFSPPLVIDGYPALDWVKAIGADSPRYTLTVYQDEYTVTVATTDDYTLGDRIAIYRSVVIND